MLNGVSTYVRDTCRGVAYALPQTFTHPLLLVQFHQSTILSIAPSRAMTYTLRDLKVLQADVLKEWETELADQLPNVTLIG